MDLPCYKYENYYEKIKVNFDTCNIMTLDLNLSARHDKGSRSKKCFRIKTYSHKCGREEGSESQYFQIDHHFWNWSLDYCECFKFL